METAIAKLLAEYEEKINLADKYLESNKAANANARREGNSEMMFEYKVERVEWSTRKQTLIQAKADIECLLDHIKVEP